SGLSASATLAAAQASYQQLTDALSAIVTGLREALSPETASPNGLAHALQQQYAALTGVQVVDLSNLRAPFTAAIQSLEQAVDKLDFQKARDQVAGVFTKV